MSKVETALEGIGTEAARAFGSHLSGGTSAEWLAAWLTRAGFPVSATSLRNYRRAMPNDGE